MKREELEEAEKLLNRLSDRWPEKKGFQAGLARRRGELDKAAEIYETQALHAATDLYTALVSLQELAIQQGRGEDSERLAALIRETVERYHLIPGTAPVGILMEGTARRDRDMVLAAARELLEGLEQTWDGGFLYPHLTPDGGQERGRAPGRRHGRLPPHRPGHGICPGRPGAADAGGAVLPPGGRE